MKKAFARLGLMALAGFSMFAVTINADTNVAPKKAMPAPRYDASQEITIHATVLRVVQNGGAGSLSGGHLILAGANGSMDGVLGPFALRGLHAMKITAGEKVTVVGAPATIRNIKVFLVRSVVDGSRTYNIRSVHGVPLLSGSTGLAPVASMITGGRR